MFGKFRLQPIYALLHLLHVTHTVQHSSRHSMAYWRLDSQRSAGQWGSYHPHSLSPFPTQRLKSSRLRFSR
ncbi:uncharacterized protein LY79DRAFT_532905 [Colletotrichum navitas]|uniref:Secreted protein n=1 Tax=Colletotrichum navitas TaxID=681940 RepID=A0AAD8QD86_9PEZI|nr:uncharacterized protein LY79DRAFT_532905 [Colletotrichum navitas]KAK1600220.1 hypothetical protein LY79DRAFT_532905 [Colletotrichum navitas]